MAPRYRLGVGELGQSANSADDMDIDEMGLDELGLNETGLNEMGINEMGINEMGLNEMGINHVIIKRRHSFLEQWFLVCVVTIRSVKWLFMFSFNVIVGALTNPSLNKCPRYVNSLNRTKDVIFTHT